ncbi:hypothetical protein ACN28S_07890 [Cystobacter fuscus]
MSAKRATLSLALAIATVAAPANAQIQPNSSFFSVSGYFYPDQYGDYVSYRVSGFAQPRAPNLPARLFILPTFKVRAADIKFFGTNGQQFDPRVNPDRAAGSVTITARSEVAMPNEAQRPAIAAALQGQSLPSFLPPPWTQPNNEPTVYGPAQVNYALIEAIRTDYKVYTDSIAAQKKFADQYGEYQHQSASLNQLKVSLAIDNEEIASRTLPGSSTGVPSITLVAPSEYQKNKLLEGGFELLVSYRFLDSKTSSVAANFDFRQAVTNFLEETQSAITKSKSSGFQVFHIGSRRTKMTTSLNSSLRTEQKIDEMKSTRIVMVDADEDMVKRFEADFFPEVSKQEVIDRHLAAAATARSAGALDLAKAHQDYAEAISKENELQEVDAVAAAAALNAGDFAGFVANGVRSMNSNDKKANNFRRVVNASSEIEQKKEWQETKSVSVQREVSVPVELERPLRQRPSIGICGARFIPYTAVERDAYGNPRQVPNEGMLLTCLVAGSPAVKAGLIPGMVVTAINTNPVTTVSELEQTMSAFNPGTRFPFCSRSHAEPSLHQGKALPSQGNERPATQGR